MHEEQWSVWLRAAIEGDKAAYERFLVAVTPYLRALAKRRCQQFRTPPGEVEDVVQEVLLAIHLKRGTWDPTRPVGPWLAIIVRNKMIDSLRRRGRHVTIPIDDVVDTLVAVDQPDAFAVMDAERLVERLGHSQREIVRSVSINGQGIRETAARLEMTEGAVRVALHRALKTLAALYRSDVREN